MRILIVSPHPDDAEYGCGGLISRLTEEGHNVTILLFNNSGALLMKHSSKAVTFQTRLQEQRKAAARLYASLEIMSDDLRFQAAKFQEICLSHTVGRLDDVFGKYNPDTVILPFPSYNQDHQYVFDACMAALRPNVYPKVSILCYEQPLDFHTEKSLDSYTYYVPLTPAQLIAKNDALSCHESQLKGRSENNLLSTDAVEALARLRGLQCGHSFAECFKPIRVNHETIF